MNCAAFVRFNPKIKWFISDKACGFCLFIKYDCIHIFFFLALFSRYMNTNDYDPQNLHIQEIEQTNYDWFISDIHMRSTIRIRLLIKTNCENKVSILLSAIKINTEYYLANNEIVKEFCVWIDYYCIQMLWVIFTTHWQTGVTCNRVSRDYFIMPFGICMWIVMKEWKKHTFWTSYSTNTHFERAIVIKKMLLWFV